MATLDALSDLAKLKKLNCRWVELIELPPGITDAKQLSWRMAHPLGMGAQGMLLSECVAKDIIAQGEDAADMQVIMMEGELSLADYDDVTYGLFLHPDYNRIYKLVCGVRAGLPWMIVGGLAGGIGGFVTGNKVMGQSLMGATLGILLGIAGGYGAHRLTR